MMEFVDVLPLWAAAATVFLLRATDVSLGTIRVILVVNGYKWYAATLGFFEILLWVVVVSQVVMSVRQHPGLMVAYAGGFALGNVIGVTIERKLAIGRSVALMISRTKGSQIAGRLREAGYRLTTLRGEGRDGPRTILYATARRREVPGILATARQADSDLFYVINHCSETSYATELEPGLGLRAFFKRK